MPTNYTLHGPSGCTVVYALSTGDRFDAVAFLSDGSRASLPDEVESCRSLWQTAKWIIETAELGDAELVAEVVCQLYEGATPDEVGNGPAGQVCQVLLTLRELRS